MKRTLASVMSVALVAGLALVASPTGVAQTPAEVCGLTTLEATIHIGEDGRLECGPGQPIVVREDLAGAKGGRQGRRQSLLSFLSIADVQLADEESPVRGEWADKCPPDSPIADSAWRPHETMVPHLMNAHVRAANLIAQAGSPVLGSPFDFVIGLGDLADNQQYNEIRWIIDLFDGNKLVDPDSGADGYDGVQAQDPDGFDGEPVASPTGERILDLANEPFWAEGVTLPWYSLPGNHDVKVQGTIPDDDPAWRNLTRAYVQGHLKIMDLAPDYQARLCQGDFTVFEDIFSDPANAGTTKVVPADPKRMLLYRSDEAKESGDEEACLALTSNEICRSSWIEEHFNTSGTPAGHGYGEGRCNDENGELLNRACYSFDRDRFHFIGIDSNPPEGFEGGNIDEAQFEWLERELIANSRTYYDEDGTKVANSDATDKLIVVFTHHTISSTDNTGFPPGSSSGRSGEDLRDLLLRFPNVILQADGHTHQNKIWAHENSDLGTGYWEVNTSAIADYPHQSRTIEIVDNRDGTLSIFAVVFDAASAPDVRTIDWAAGDPTDEIALGGATRTINELWLASYGREVGFYDPQADLTKIGEPEDRNVELVIKAPFDLGKTRKSQR